MKRSLNILPLLAVALIVTAGTASAQHPDDIYWENPLLGHSPNQFTDEIVQHGGDLYMGGNFEMVGGMPVKRIARWDGSAWSPLGTGVGTDIMGLVHTIGIKGNVLYAGGMFDQVGPFRTSNIAQYDISHGVWVPLGDGTDRAVRSIHIAENGDLYAAGEFTTADGVRAQGIARWDGYDWYDVGGSLNARSRGMTLASDGEVIYLGGYFSMAGDTPVNNIARWDGTDWTDLGGGANDLVTEIVFHDGKLYVGGAFTNVGMVPARSFAVWDGNRWKGFGSGLSGPGLSHPRAILIDGERIYVGGTFTHADGIQVNYIAMWNGSAWECMGSGLNGQVKVITKIDGKIYVGGNFTEAGGNYAPYVAVWTRDAEPVEKETPSASATTLGQNFPNPFNPTTTISFVLEGSSDVSLRVYDLGGRLVRTLVSGTRGAGPHEEQWDGRNDRGEVVGTGVYLYRLTASGIDLSRKMILLK